MSGVPGYRDTPIRSWHPDDPVDVAEAEEFLRLYHAEHPDAGPPEPRIREVRAEIAATGTYVHSGAELTFGAKVAWRNASRCIGRLYWQSLLVLDRRNSTTAEQIYHDLVAHLRVAGGGGPWAIDEGTGIRRAGQIRPVVSVFPPAEPGRGYHRVWNEQLIRYAGYRQHEGGVIGDPRYADFTLAMQRMGWRGKGESFDVLPLAIETPYEGVRLFELPEDAVLEVPLEHPEHRWFAELGLRWHAVPVISHQRLSIGGVQYPLAPFNGWYMGTEIGARNLADPERYDLLPVIAEELGLDTSRDSTLWRDRALVELNRAVLWSYERAGVRVTDHHTEARRFIAHLEREQRAGRPTPADWTWIVPPMSGATTPVYHRYYHEADQRPNFYLDEVARDLGRYGRADEPPRRASRVIPGPRTVVLRPPVPQELAELDLLFGGVRHDAAPGW
ncbi:MAG: nitric oxide synthase oxygenase [Actinobacteria bacterium 13_2_20CM_2_71_6]|nr:MAG: nitric oxide synthase oxygenase [Actinobacteria bacterium 13_2_20CM_2_71_6]